MFGAGLWKDSICLHDLVVTTKYYVFSYTHTPVFCIIMYIGGVSIGRILVYFRQPF
jgi:hypothetical protein